MKHPSPLAVRWRRLLTGALAGSLVLTPMLSGVAHAAEIAPAETAAEYVLDAPLEADGYTAPAPLADEYPIGEYAAPEFDYLTIYTDSVAQHQDAVEYEVAQLASRSLTSNQIVNGWSWGGSNITLGARPWIEARSAHFNHTWPEAHLVRSSMANWRRRI